MKYHVIELEGEDVNFRLTSSDCVELEKKTGKAVQEYIQNVSNTSCVTLLKYMRRSSIPTFSDKDANTLYDKLIDNDYSLESIYMDIILPTCVVSGLLTQSNLDDLKRLVDDPEAIQAMRESQNKQKIYTKHYWNTISNTKNYTT